MASKSGLRKHSFTFSLLAALAIFLLFNLYMRHLFAEATGIDLPVAAIPLKFETRSSGSPDLYLAFVTLPGSARGLAHRRPLWAGSGWSDAKTDLYFHPGRRLLRGDELHWRSGSRWYALRAVQVDDRKYITSGDLLLVIPGRGMIHYLRYR